MVGGGDTSGERKVPNMAPKVKKRPLLEVVGKMPSTIDKNVARRSPEPLYVHTPGSLDKRVKSTWGMIAERLNEASGVARKAVEFVVDAEKRCDLQAYMGENLDHGVHVGEVKVPLDYMHRHVGPSTLRLSGPPGLFTLRRPYGDCGIGDAVEDEEVLESLGDTDDSDAHFTVDVSIIGSEGFRYLLCSDKWTHRERMVSTSAPPKTKRRRTMQECISDTVSKMCRHDVAFLFSMAAPTAGVGHLIAPDPSTLLFTQTFEYGAVELKHFKDTGALAKYCVPVTIATMQKRLTSAKQESVLLAATVAGDSSAPHVYAGCLADVVAVDTKGATSTGNRAPANNKQKAKKASKPPASSRRAAAGLDGELRKNREQANTLSAPMGAPLAPNYMDSIQLTHSVLPESLSSPMRGKRPVPSSQAGAVAGAGDTATAATLPSLAGKRPAEGFSPAGKRPRCEKRIDMPSTARSGEEKEESDDDDDGDGYDDDEDDDGEEEEEDIFSKRDTEGVDCGQHYGIDYHLGLEVPQWPTLDGFEFSTTTEFDSVITAEVEKALAAPGVVEEQGVPAGEVSEDTLMAEGRLESARGPETPQVVASAAPLPNIRQRFMGTFKRGVDSYWKSRVERQRKKESMVRNMRKLVENIQAHN